MNPTCHNGMTWGLRRDDKHTRWQAFELHALADLLVEVMPGDPPTDCLDQLEALERVKVAAAAVQVAVVARCADAADSEDVGAAVRTWWAASSSSEGQDQQPEKLL